MTSETRVDGLTNQEPAEHSWTNHEPRSTSNESFWPDIFHQLFFKHIVTSLSFRGHFLLCLTFHVYVATSPKFISSTQACRALCLMFPIVCLRNASDLLNKKVDFWAAMGNEMAYIPG